jgi:exodeoxyribonuclease VII small subunit
MNDTENLTFEEAMLQLENIVRELEAGRIKLDDAVNAYTKAITLKNFCEQKHQKADAVTSAPCCHRFSI